MIKKLRMKLIIASMISLLAVLLIIEGIAGALNYNRIVAEADQTLEILEENNGKFPDVPPPEKPSEKKKEGRMSSELPYESRYFSVLLDSEGEVLTTDTGKIARIDTSDAVEYAKQVLKSGKERGFLEGYRYVVVNSDSEVRVIFLVAAEIFLRFRILLYSSRGLHRRSFGSTYLDDISVGTDCKAVFGKL